MTMTRLRSVWLPVLLQTVLVLSACGDDEDDDDTPPAGDAGLDGGRDGGGGDATVPKDASADAAKDSGPVAVTCGSITCPVPQAIPGFPPVVPCCHGGNTCSAIQGGVCGAPALRDTSCTTLMNVPLAGTVYGCCTAASNGKCGLDSTQLGLGCRALDDPQVVALFSQIPGVTLPPVTACRTGDAGTLRVTFGMDSGL